MGAPDDPTGAMADFVFRRRTPSGILGRLVESIWYARGVVPYDQEQVAPTGSTVAAVVLGDPIRQQAANGHGEELTATTGFLVGPHDEPMINAPTGETYAVGIVTTPIGCQPLFGIAPLDLARRVVDLESWWPEATTLRRLLRAGDPDPDRMLDGTVELLDRRARAVELGQDIGRIEQAVAMVEADPLRPISTVAEAVGLSHGHLDDEFGRLVGLSPRALSRLLRMRRLLDEVNDADRDGGFGSWSELAARHGWFDQAHMNRDFKRHTGVSPTVYMSRRRQAFGEVPSEPGFVPEPHGPNERI